MGFWNFSFFFNQREFSAFLNILRSGLSFCKRASVCGLSFLRPHCKNIQRLAKRYANVRIIKPLPILLKKIDAARRQLIDVAACMAAASQVSFVSLCKKLFQRLKAIAVQRTGRLHVYFAWHRLAGALFVSAMLLAAYQSGVLLERSSTMEERDLLVYAQERAADARQLKINQTRLLARELGLIQARITRLEVLGQRLAESQDLGQEFNFSRPPGLGGGLLPPSPQSKMNAYELSAVMQKLNPHAEHLEMQLAMIGDFIEQHKLRINMMPKGWPVDRGWISSRFGRRNSPFTGAPEMHEGIDIAGREGTPILAVAAGVVRKAAMSRDYGYMVEIDHGNGYSTRYAHNKTNLVREGELVQQGSVIAQLGNTGRSTGNHLHFEVLKHGQAIDPQIYLNRH